MSVNSLILEEIDKKTFITFTVKGVEITKWEGKDGKSEIKKKEIDFIPTSTIKMPLPKTLSDNLKINYIDQESIVSSLLNTGQNKLGMGTQVINQIGARAIPQKWKNFNGIEQSDWTFDWEFIFKSRKESQKLLSNISIFRALAAGFGTVQTSSGATGTIGSFQFTFGAPAVWTIELNAQDLSEVITFPKDLILTNVVTNFSGNAAVGIFKHNQGPIKCSLTLNFSPAHTTMPEEIYGDKFIGAVNKNITNSIAGDIETIQNSISTIDINSLNNSEGE